MHTEAYEAVQFSANLTQIAHLRQEGLDLGGQYVNGSCRELFPNTTWTGLDWVPGPGIDIVADARTWTPTRKWDVVLCTEMLEHVDMWKDIVRVCSEALVDGGYLFLTCASTGRPEHSSIGHVPVPAGEHYGNVDAEELREVAQKYFSEVVVQYNSVHSDAYLVAVK